MKFIYTVILIPVTLFAIYFGYVQYKNSVIAKSEIKQLQQIIELKDKKLNFYQQVNEKTIKEKSQLQNKSIELTEKLKDALKNKTCSDELVASFISDKLYERAYQIRRISKDTRKLAN